METKTQPTPTLPKPSMIKKRSIPTFVGVAVLMIGLITGVVLVSREQQVETQATGETSPKDVRITNIADNSFTVVWTTDAKTNGFIEWGEDVALGKTVSEKVQSESNLHWAEVSGLSPSTTYYFNINTGGESFDNNGQPWSIQTGPELPSPKGAQPISGTIYTPGNSPAIGAVVIINVGGAGSLSTTTTSNGNWIIPLSTMRTRDLSEYMQITENETVLEIFVLGENGEISTATANPNSARPLADIVLGETYDFRNNLGETGAETESSITLPEDSSASSRFDTETTNPEANSTPATIESIDEGEIISTTNPEFFGDGPAGGVITVTVESDPITEQVQVSSTGEWSWSPPDNLEEGSHKITVTWRDANGILRSITRNFVVQAADEPAFESTPSATRTPSSTPIATSTPRPTPTAVPTIQPTISPVATITPQHSPLPDAGVLTPTLGALMMGLGLLLTSIGVFIVANK